MLSPRQAGTYVSKLAKNVFLEPEGIKKCASILSKKVLEGDLTVDSFKQNEIMPLHSGLSKTNLVDWVFLVDAINFSFWSSQDQPRYTVTHNSKTRMGYLAMTLALNRAIDNGLPIWDPNFYSKLSVDEAKEIFRSDSLVEMPMIKKRIDVMKEVGSTLIEKFSGSFSNVVKKCDGSALKLVNLIFDNFPSFQDTAVYENKKIAILKRAQIVVADLWLLFSVNGSDYFHDLDQLTMFADYRVPQVLNYYCVLRYSESLLEKLNKNYLFTSGETEEVEIRCCSIEAVERIVEETNKILANTETTRRVNSIVVDFFLWDTSSQCSEIIKYIPYHKIRDIYY